MKQSLFLYRYLLIIVLFSIQTTINLLFPHPVSASNVVFMSFPLWITGGSAWEGHSPEWTGQGPRHQQATCVLNHTPCCRCLVTCGATQRRHTAGLLSSRSGPTPRPGAGTDPAPRMPQGVCAAAQLQLAVGLDSIFFPPRQTHFPSAHLGAEG